MELIKRQKWEKLFKRRELVHVDAVKEFYARLTLSHFKKKEVACSSVRGVEIKFDHMKLASILGIPDNNEIWRMKCGRLALVRIGEEMMRLMLQQKRQKRKKRLRIQVLIGKSVVDEATDQGKSGSDDQFFDAQVNVEEPTTEAPAVPVFPASSGDSINVQKEPVTAGIDPSAPTGSIPDAIFSSLQADFERARANRIQADLEKAQAENGRLVALLQQAQSQPKP
ncbi:hypothetical protein Dimus_005053 [Dionaea muscipula]